MIKVGITGGIGSGKTTVCKEWEKLGAVVFYADDEAKKLMVTDPAVKQKLTDTFGPETYHSDGSLNKAHLIGEAFKKGRVEELNRIVHPAVARAFLDKSEELKRSGTKLIVKEAALLLNNGRPPELDIVVIVRSDKNKRLKRVAKRDVVTEAEVDSRIQKQPDFDKMMNLADYTIENDGMLDELAEKAKRLFDEIMERGYSF
jgi:dephospho-CoA kinase